MLALNLAITHLYLSSLFEFIIVGSALIRKTILIKSYKYIIFTRQSIKRNVKADQLDNY